MNSLVKSETKQYVRPIPMNWWMKRSSYAKFIVRELTGLFLAAYALFLVSLIALARDAGKYHMYIHNLDSGLSYALHMVLLFFALYHSVTFFELTPRVLRIHRGEEKVPERAISGAHYLAWLVVTLVLFFLATRRSY